ncbi:MAG TPA: tRNA uridine-5-carboxymethylaminomethyl(34) synthesis GTPase MnmE [Stellaceae bacterium]|nr:tRNA uridine-5-carboxymethylaminomethyl(34) synthesis GTPase MnmE [Stellaceae bacterium]
MSAEDTIFAPATAPGRAAIAIVRISGPRAGTALQTLAGALPAPRAARHVRLHDPQTRDAIDDAIALWFPGPQSVTGEDVVELQVHGSRAVVAALISVLGRMGLRLAEPGEFTRRAFLNHKLDLTQAEAIADLTAAETEAQRRRALRQLDGALGDLYRDWSARLLRMLAHLEAAIDFPDEDLPSEIEAKITAETSRLVCEIETHLADQHRGERLRDGIAIAIVGPPNAGKSSLLNRLARREAAITSPIAGTTRDVIEVAIDLGGYPAVLADTAGLRESADIVEQEGLRRALARAEAAELRLFVFDAARPQDTGRAAAWPGSETLLIANKIDTVSDQATLPADAIRVSALTGEGISALVETLTRRIEADYESSAPLLTRARHREALEAALNALHRALHAALPELKAEDLRLAWRSLGRITGRVDVEDLLDVIFADFCIGK